MVAVEGIVKRTFHKSRLNSSTSVCVVRVRSYLSSIKKCEL